jgi:hypothetical protein
MCVSRWCEPLSKVVPSASAPKQGDVANQTSMIKVKASMYARQPLYSEVKLLDYRVVGQSKAEPRIRCSGRQQAGIVEFGTEEVVPC